MKTIKELSMIYETLIERPLAPAVFLGVQDLGEGKSMDLYNLTANICDKTGKVLHPKGSTVSTGTLLKLGFRLPPKMRV